MKQSFRQRISFASAPNPPANESKSRETLRLLFFSYFEHSVSRNAAALAYYLLFALFPLLIFVSNLLGLLHLDVASITRELLPVLPGDIIELLSSYLNYVSQNSSPVLLSFSLVFTIYFPMRATKGLMVSVRMAYRLPKPRHSISYAVRQLIYTLMLLLVIALTLLLSTMGQRVLRYVIEWIPALEHLQIPGFLLTLWHYLRFLLLGVIMFAALATLYAASQDQRQPVSAILPGAMAALAAWLVVSFGFSFYVDHFANYSIIYGTLGTVIVLLVWLYMTAVTLIMGAELNAALNNTESGKPEDPRRNSF